MLNSLRCILNQVKYPNLITLAAIGVTLPTTPMNCERRIFAYNSIKRDSRNLLTVKNVEHLMLVFLKAPELGEFDFEKAFNIWANKKKRKGLISMVNRVKKNLTCKDSDLSSAG